MRPMPTSPHVQFRIPRSLNQELERAAEENERPKAGQIRYYLRKGLREDGYLAPDEPEDETED